MKRRLLWTCKDVKGSDKDTIWQAIHFDYTLYATLIYKYTQMIRASRPKALHEEAMWINYMYGHNFEYVQ
jgi:hypothetical protein